MKDSGSSLVSTLAFTMSVLALATSGFALYQTMTLRQSPIAANAAAPSAPAAPSGADSSPAAVSPTAVLAAGIQPGQFVQPAFEAIGEVELLSVKRIKDPDTGSRDVVNIQFRLRRLSDKNAPVLNDFLYGGQTTARNPETSETYQPVDALKRSTSPIAIDSLRVNASVDGYVWMKIPEGVNTIDIFLENTQAFKNVPIAN